MAITGIKAKSALGLKKISSTDKSVENNITDDIEVEKIELSEKLSDGSANDGTGINLQKGLIFGNTYTFRVTKFINGQPKTITTINWEIKYHSLKQNKIVTLTSKSFSYYLRFDKNSLYDEKGNHPEMEDLCGRMIFVRAFIKNKNLSNRLEIWHHNRFIYIDRQVLEEEILERQISPWLINQIGTSLCGPASIFYIFAKYNFLEYYKFTKELFRTGKAKYYNYEVTPHKKAYAMFEMSPDSKNWPKNKKGKKIAEVDWLTLASLRSSANDVLGVYKGDNDDTTAVNWPKMMVRLCEDFLGYKDVQGLNLYSRKKFTKDHNTIGKLINKINSEIGNGCKLMLLIDSDLLIDDVSFDLEYHWVVLETPIKSIVEFDDENEIIKKIDFVVFSWGTNIFNKKERYLNSPISYEHFMNNFYGYIKMK